jgi:hypothetical protein
VVRSGFWARRPGAEAVVRRRHAAILEAADQLGDAVYRVHYDEWVSDPEALRGLFDWLGIRFDLPQVTEVMAQPHSFRNRNVDHLEEPPVPVAEPFHQRAGVRRGLVFAWAVVSAAQVAALATALVGTGPFAD